MTKSELLIRSILGAVGRDIRPLSCAVDVTEELLFVKHIPMDDIQVTKLVYPLVAKQLHKSNDAVSRGIERLANLCWDNMGPDDVLQYIGKPLRDIQAPRDIIFYFAFFIHFNKPFFEVVASEPALLF